MRVSSPTTLSSFSIIPIFMSFMTPATEGAAEISTYKPSLVASASAHSMVSSSFTSSAKPPVLRSFQHEASLRWSDCKSLCHSTRCLHWDYVVCTLLVGVGNRHASFGLDADKFEDSVYPARRVQFLEAFCASHNPAAGSDWKNHPIWWLPIHLSEITTSALHSPPRDSGCSLRCMFSVENCGSTEDY